LWLVLVSIEIILSSWYLESALVTELNSKIQSIENEMDIRVESLISSIHDYRDECKQKLDNLKDDFEK
jgi:hypothetical protein